MSQLKVNTIRHTSASSDAITLASDGTATAKITNVAPGNRNLVVNGACIVSQRGTADTAGNQGYQTVDRYKLTWNGANNVLEQHQNGLGSSDTGPWEAGFRKSFYVRNGDQTASSPNDDQVVIETRLEAQELANSGWNYTSASSYITLSFWVKSSVAQTFYGVLETQDGTGQNYPFSTGSLSANTWTKVTKTIPGHANLQFDNNTSNGLQIEWHPFMGTDFTDNSVSLNTWAAAASGTRHPDMTSTWWTTDDATFELTGVQLEVGDTATDFEHRSYGDELARCQRYYLQYDWTDTYESIIPAVPTGANECRGTIFFPVAMRTAPTQTESGVGDFRVNSSANDEACDDIQTASIKTTYACLEFHKTTGNLTAWEGALISTQSGNDASLYFSAEL